MVINYTWVFNNLGIYPTQYGKTDMVYVVVWQLFATTESNGKTYETGTTGTIDIVYNPNAEWIEFVDLIPSEVQHWVEDQMELDNPGNLALIKSILEQDLQNKVNNELIIVDAPWNTTTTTTTTITPEETTTTTTTIV